MKPGYKTTEFWLSLISIASMAFGLPITPDVSAAVIGGVTAAYSVARGLSKKDKQ